MTYISSHSSGIPRIDKLEIEGRGFHTNLYAVRGIYSGGKEGKSRIQWLRSMVGSPDLISIPGMASHFVIAIQFIHLLSVSFGKFQEFLGLLVSYII